MYNLKLKDVFIAPGRQVKNIGGRLVVFFDGLAQNVSETVAELARRQHYIESVTLSSEEEVTPEVSPNITPEVVPDVEETEEVVFEEPVEEEVPDEVLEEMYEEEDQLSEKTKERVVRGGKKTRKLKCKSGYKAVGNKCVKMSSSEKHTRSKAAKKGARKSKSKKASTQRKRAKSMRKR